jgi:hypothetical protein
MGTGASFPGGKVAGDMRLTTYLHLGPRSGIIELCLHSPIRLHCVVLNELSTQTTLTYLIIVLYTRTITNGSCPIMSLLGILQRMAYFLHYLTTLCRLSEWNDESECMWKTLIFVCCKAFTQHLFEGTEESHGKFQLWKPGEGLRIETRTSGIWTDNQANLAFLFNYHLSRSFWY